MDSLRPKVFNSNTMIRDIDLSDITYDHVQGLLALIPEPVETYSKHMVLEDKETDRIVYLIKWAPNQMSGAHDHPELGCLLKVLCGKLIEISYNEENPEGIKRFLKKGDTSYQVGKKGIHNIINSNNSAITLHIYSSISYKPTFIDLN